MLPSAIILAMRRKAKVNTTQYSDADALIDLNIRKNEFWSALMATVQEPYDWQQWTSESVSLQSEYPLVDVTTTTAGTKLLNSLSIAYDSETYTDTGSIEYTKARRVDPFSLPKDWNYYVENQNILDPIYYIADNSVFIAPAPRSTEAGTNRIKLTGIRNIPDWTLSSIETAMKIPVDQQESLVYGLVVDALYAKGSDDGTINNAEARWIRRKTEAIKTMENRLEATTFMLYPNQTAAYNSNDIIFS